MCPLGEINDRKMLYSVKPTLEHRIGGVGTIGEMENFWEINKKGFGIKGGGKWMR